MCRVWVVMVIRCVEWVVKSTEDYNRKFTCSTRS